MRLETVEQRHKIVDGMIQKSFEIDELYLHDESNVDDWIANSEILKNLLALDKMIHTEKIFLYMLDEMEEFPSHSPDKKILVSIAGNSVHYYIESVLLNMLEYSCGAMNDWKFKTAVGKRFHRSTARKLNELADKYRELYGFADEAADDKKIPVKLDTSKDRLATVKSFFNRAMKINDVFRSGEQVEFGDVLGLMAIMEKLTGLEDAINTEIYFEDALNDMMDIKSEREDTRQKFLSPFAQQSEHFMKTILVRRIDGLIGFTDNRYRNQQLIDFQAELSTAMVDLRKKYAEIYHV